MAQDLWESWLKLLVSICTLGTAHPAPCLGIPTRTCVPVAGHGSALPPQAFQSLLGKELFSGVTHSDWGITQCALWHELSMASCFCCCQGLAVRGATLAILRP